MTCSFQLSGSDVHPQLVAELNDFDHQKEKKRARSLRTFMGKRSFAVQMMATPINLFSLVVNATTPIPFGSFIMALNMLSLLGIGANIAMWLLHLPSFYSPDALATAQAKLRALIVEMNTAHPSLQPVFQNLEPTIALGDIVWITHVYNVLHGYDAQKDYDAQRVQVQYDAIVRPIHSPTSNKLRV